MESSLTVLYDAYTLYSATLRDLLMELALIGLIQAQWTDEIHDEWIRNLLENRPDIQRGQLERIKDSINQHVGDCLITGYEDLIPSLSLPDPGDRHILAAAIKGKVDIILTFNLKDFPQDSLAIYSIEAQHPDHFIADLIDLHPRIVVKAVEICRQRLKNPPKSISEYLDMLLNQGLNSSVSMLREIYEDV